jgi:hypothetical protein
MRDPWLRAASTSTAWLIPAVWWINLIDVALGLFAGTAGDSSSERRRGKMQKPARDDIPSTLIALNVLYDPCVVQRNVKRAHTLRSVVIGSMRQRSLLHVMHRHARVAHHVGRHDSHWSCKITALRYFMWVV